MIFQIKKASIKIIVFTAIVLSSVEMSKAQMAGINFQNNLSWSEVKQKAKKQHKLIFIDCYASWCGPCKYMAQNIFTLKDVGDYMNSKFISVSVQFDKTPGDTETV